MGNHIKEVNHVSFLRQAAPPQPDAAQVDAQVTVSAQYRGQSISGNGHGKDENGLVLVGLEGATTQDPGGQTSQQQAARNPQGDLLEQQQGN